MVRIKRRGCREVEAALYLRPKKKNSGRSNDRALVRSQRKKEPENNVWSIRPGLQDGCRKIVVFENLSHGVKLKVEVSLGREDLSRFGVDGVSSSKIGSSSWLNGDSNLGQSH